MPEPSSHSSRPSPGLQVIHSGRCVITKSARGSFTVSEYNKSADPLTLEWKEMVDLASEVGMAREPELKAARERLLPEELTNFRTWIGLILPAHKEQWSRYDRRWPGVDEAPPLDQANLILLDGDLIQLGRNEFAADELVKLSCYMLSHRRTLDLAPDQYSPFLFSAMLNPAGNRDVVEQAAPEEDQPRLPDISAKLRQILQKHDFRDSRQ